MQSNYTTRYSNDECICGATQKTLTIDNLTKTRTLLRCYKCRGIVAWWDHETDAEQEERIRKYNEKHPALNKWTQEELESLHKPRDLTETEREELA